MKYILALSLAAAKIEVKTFNSHNYTLFDDEQQVPYSDAYKICEALGGYLCQVDGEEEKQWLVDTVSADSYVQSWNGDSYGETCLVASPLGNIVVPLNGCDGPNGFVCEFNNETEE